MRREGSFEEADDHVLHFSVRLGDEVGEAGLGQDLLVRVECFSDQLDHYTTQRCATERQAIFLIFHCLIIRTMI